VQWVTDSGVQNMALVAKGRLVQLPDKYDLFGRGHRLGHAMRCLRLRPVALRPPASACLPDGRRFAPAQSGAGLCQRVGQMVAGTCG
jgi:hypothetical protein